MALRPGLLAGALILAACGRGGVELAWEGADTGQASLQGFAARCDGGRFQLFAVSGDTGVGIVAYAQGDTLAGEYPVRLPMEAERSRPAAGIGARWLDSNVVSGYRSDSGTLTLALDGDLASGQFDARLRRQGDLQEVRLRGSFERVRIGACVDSAR